MAQPISAVDIANSINYATLAVYAPQGALAQVEYGTNLTSTLLYNKRLQPCWLYATTGSALATTTLCTAADPGPGNILDLQYGLNLGSGNNGNVISIANNRDSTRTQSFTYDQVNRIVTAETSSTYATSPAHCWGESYTTDQWGNMTAIGVASSAYNGCTQETLGVSATANNQLSATGFSYDSSGNMLTDAVNTYAWNAEGEIKSAASVNYTYDGDGNRLEKSSSKIYWYGAGTEILDESDLSGNFTNEYVFFGGKRIAMRNVPSGTIYYYAEDFLGSSRTLVQAGQTSVCYDGDFYPFGGERDILTTCSQNYKFEGKERDTETNNDDFGARYYTSRLGRWLSSDWSSVPVPVPYANLTNPQTLNLYAMVRDNPETFADLDGHQDAEPDPEAVAREDEKTDEAIDAALEALSKQNAPGLNYWRVNGGDDPLTGMCYVGTKNEPPQLTAGREAHNNEEVRPGEEKEVRTADGKGRMDRYDKDKGHIREIKPDNARGEKEGRKQLARYKRAQEKATRKSHTTELTKYKTSPPPPPPPPPPTPSGEK